jgi:hypothetical protein
MTILGLSLFGWFHTLLSIAMLVAGFVVVRDLLNSRINSGWMAAFLITGVLTSATGFGFPFDRLGDSHYVGIVSLVVLALSILGLYVFRFRGPWRWIFALGIVLAFYFDVFVAIAQLFKKVPALRAMAPTLSEPPFLVVQTVVLALFVWLCVVVARRFQPDRAVAVA